MPRATEQSLLGGAAMRSDGRGAAGGNKKPFFKGGSAGALGQSRPVSPQRVNNIEAMMDGRFVLSLHTLFGDVVTVQASADTKVYMVKEDVRKQKGEPIEFVDGLRLLYKKQPLEDERTLGSYDLSDGEVVMMSQQDPAKGRAERQARGERALLAAQRLAAEEAAAARLASEEAAALAVPAYFAPAQVDWQAVNVDGRVLAAYQQAELAVADATAAAQRWPTLQLGVENPPSSASSGPHELMKLSGLLPISFRGVVYNIPITVWLPVEYPARPCTPFLTPTPEMRIVPNHQHVGSDGMCYFPCTLHLTTPLAFDSSHWSVTQTAISGAKARTCLGCCRSCRRHFRRGRRSRRRRRRRPVRLLPRRPRRLGRCQATAA